MRPTTAREQTALTLAEVLHRVANTLVRSRALHDWSETLGARSRHLTRRQPSGGSDGTETRTERTIATARRGALPLAIDGRVWVGPGVAKACNGCGDLITHAEREFVVEVSEVLTFRFHAECHRAWVTFTRIGGASLPPAP